MGRAYGTQFFSIVLFFTGLIRQPTDGAKTCTVPTELALKLISILLYPFSTGLIRLTALQH